MKTSNLAQVKNINTWHRDLADWLLVHGGSPGWNRRASEHFKVTPVWISTVVHSDAFQDYYGRLRAENSSVLLHTTREKLTGVLDQAIEKLSDKIESTPDLPIGNILDTIDILAKRTGHGEASGSSNQIVNNIFSISKEDLAESRARMRGASPKALEEGPLVIEGIAGEISS